MFRFLLLLFLAAVLAFGETFKLFLKDGDFHMVREYQVQGDRIRYYSTERGDWEEIPKDLVDLEKTEGATETETAKPDQRSSGTGRRGKSRARSEARD